jgi:hypothetical protein
MKVILGDYSDIPEDLAEPTVNSTASDVTLSFDTCIELDAALRASL